MNSNCARLLNDLQTNEKEREQGCVNSVPLAVRSPPWRLDIISVHRGSEGGDQEGHRGLPEGPAEAGAPRGWGHPEAVQGALLEQVAHLFYLQGDGFLLLQVLMAAAIASVREPSKYSLQGSTEI